MLLPSNLVDTTDLETFTQELRLGSSTTTGRCSGWSAASIPTPTASTASACRRRATTPSPTPRFGAGTSAAVANGFPLNSPYNADLPYDIKQSALFGEASYDITQRFTVTAGGRYYDFEGDARSSIRAASSPTATTISTRPRRAASARASSLSYELADNVRINAQASKGFRLGGVNDPLNMPLCTGGAERHRRADLRQSPDL